MMQVVDLYKRFKTNEVLKKLNLTFGSGEVVAILGPNGSGKTTLIKCIMGMVIPDKGEIRLDGENILGQSAYRSKISYLPQIARFPENLTVQEIVKMVADLRGGKVDPQKYLDTFDLSPFMDQPLRSLSGGTLQKVNLVLALMKDNDLIILDEPTSGLDPLAMRNLRAIIVEERKKGKTVVITTHIMSFAEEMSDRIVYLLDGHIHFDGGVKGMKEQFGGTTLEDAIARILEGDHSDTTPESAGLASGPDALQKEVKDESAS